MRMFITMLLFLMLFAGAIILQIFLSNKKNKPLGFLLPSISFVISVIVAMWVLGLINLNFTTEFYGNFETKSIIELWNERSDENIRQFISIITDSAIKYFFLLNIPTVLFLLVNVACKRKQKRNSAIQKMSVQDLE